MVKTVSCNIITSRFIYFSIQLTDEEMNYFRQRKNTIHGLADDTERCYIEVRTVQEILLMKIDLDWATIGQIMYVAERTTI